MLRKRSLTSGTYCDLGAKGARSKDGEGKVVHPLGAALGPNSNLWGNALTVFRKPAASEGSGRRGDAR